MKRNIGKHVSKSLRQAKEDMRELQRLMTHKSVYAKQYIVREARRPKHRNRAFEYYEGMG
jgi:hypothetical protein